jgi:hypothetical protein
MTRGQHRDAFVVDELAGPRFELAIERLREGHTFEFHDVGFRLEHDRYLVCIVDSSCGIEAISAPTAMHDLRVGATVVDRLLLSSPTFSAAVQGRQPRFELVVDYGEGSILICSNTEDVVTWVHGFPRAGG